MKGLGDERGRDWENLGFKAMDLHIEIELELVL